MRVPTSCLAGLLILAIAVPCLAGDEIKKLRTRAESGDAAAQVELGNAYYEGKGIAKDHVEAVRWYRNAAEQGSMLGQVSLGNLYSAGDGVTADAVEAARWYRKAADQGNLWAQLYLGLMYRDGRGVPFDQVEGTRWLRKAAEGNLPQAQAVLGACYQVGSGAPQDFAEALSWYHKAAAQNHPDAMFAVGYFYEQGWTVPRDLAQARQWYQKAADLKDARAKFRLELAGAPWPNPGELAPFVVTLDVPSGTAYGFITDPKGYLVTSAAAVRNVANLSARRGSDTFSAKVIGTDDETDIAVLRIASPQPLPAVEFASPDAATSALRVFSTAVRKTDAAVNWSWGFALDRPVGRPGAPVIAEGRVAGMCITPNFDDNRSHIVNARMMTQVYEQLTGPEHRMVRGAFGLRFSGATETGGIQLVAVAGPAEAAGLHAGDVITALDGRPIASKEELIQETSLRRPGSTAVFTYRRQGVEGRASLTVGDRAVLYAATSAAGPSGSGNQGGDATTRLTAAHVVVENVDAAPATGARHPHAYALVIGAEKYRAPIPHVPFALNDAAVIRDYLQTTLGVPAENVRGVADPTLGDLRSGVSWLRNQAANDASPDLTLFVYYAGHGVPELQSGKPYLLPVDANPEYVRETGYPLDGLISELAQMPGRTVVIVDACFSGTAARAAGANAGLMAGKRPAFIATALPKGERVAVLAAVSPSQTSNALPEAQHGLFTYFVLHGLSGKAADAQGHITLGSLYDYVRAQVSSAAAKMNQEQTPTLSSGAELVLVH